MRRTTILIALTFCVAGCGGAADVRDAARSKAPPCPEGTPALTAREVIGPVPRDYEVLPPEEKKAIDEYVASLREEMGKAYRSHDARVIYPRGENDGTVVIVVNTREGRPEDVVEGAKAAEVTEDIEGERLDVDGREGRLQHASDGSFVATAPTGRCSIMILIALEKANLTDAAALIGARG